MEKMEQLKAKYVKINTSVFKNLLLSQARIVDKIRKNQDQRCNEDESKIKELETKLAAMKETLNAKTEILKHKINELEEYNIHLEELKAEKKFIQDVKMLEVKRNNLKAKLAKPNLQDLKVLEEGKKKLKFYKELTRVQWDYEASEHSIKGYVTNKCDYIHHFCYENQKINEKLTDSLWHEMYLSTGESSEIRDENLESKNSAISS